MQIFDRDKKVKASEEHVRYNSEDNYRDRDLIVTTIKSIILFVCSICIYMKYGRRNTSLLVISIGSALFLVHNLYTSWGYVRNNTKTIISISALGVIIIGYNYLYNESFDNVFWTTLNNVSHIHT